MTKTCSKCAQVLALDCFSVDKRAKDGLYSLCRDCQRLVRKASALKRKAEGYKRPVDMEAERQRYRDRYACRKSDDAWIERHRANTDRWRQGNPEALRLHVLARRARVRNNGVFEVTPKDVKRLRAQPCFYCGVKADIEIDHVIPISRGGRHSIGNLVASCRTCNRSKSNRTIIEWKRAA